MNQIPQVKFGGAMRCLLTAGVLSQLGLLTPALAQTSGDTPTELKPVVVTGSLIPTAETEGPAPVTTVLPVQVERSGATTVTELMRKVNQNITEQSENISNQGSTGGTSAISLRALGSDKTLVLVNGRRMAPYAAAGNTSFVDLNSIPLAMVERIEVLTDGASAIYGSEAIGGVVNIILKKNFNGVEFSTSYGNSTESDIGEYRASLVAGTSTDKTSFLAGLDYFSRNSMLQTEREFSKTANQRTVDPVYGRDSRSSSGNPGTIILKAGSAYLAANPGSTRFGVPYTSTGMSGAGGAVPIASLLRGTTQLFDFAPYVQMIPESERKGAMALVEHELFEHVKLFAEFNYQNNKTTVQLAPTPVFGDLDGIDIPAANPWNPFGETVTFRHRLLEVGPRMNDITSETYRVVTGLKGDIADTSWQWEGAFLYAQNSVLDYGYNYVLNSDVQAALNGTLAGSAAIPGNARFLNVFGDKAGNDPRLLQLLRKTNFGQNDAELYSVDFKVTGELVKLPAGPLGMAIGGEYRSEQLTQVIDSLSASGAFAGSGRVDPTYGERDVKNAYLEFSVPILSPEKNLPGVYDLRLQLAGRIDDYSDFGDTTNPKIGLLYRPIQDVLLRASYSTGFKAPSLFGLYSGANESFPQVDDPLRDTVVTGNPDDDIKQIRSAQRGNNTLKPEESESYNLGIVYSPSYLKGLTVGADFFRTRLRNVTALLDTESVLARELTGLGANVHRLARTAADIAQGVPGVLESVDTGYFNLSSVVVEGIDLFSNYQKETSFGTFDFTLGGTYMTQYREEFLPGTGHEDLTDSFSSKLVGGAILDFKGQFTVGWEYRGIGAAATVNYMDSFDDNDGNGAFIGHTIDSFTTLDLQVSYEYKTEDTAGWRGYLNQTKLTVGALNVTDEQPPFASDTGSGNPGFLASTHDPRGRFYYIRFSKKF
jgi:outer membrane receptor protein involved in Fe transport